MFRQIFDGMNSVLPLETLKLFILKLDDNSSARQTKDIANIYAYMKSVFCEQPK